MPTTTFQGYRLFAVDGSDLRLPSDPTNDFSLIRNAEGQKQYNLAHLNAMLDLMSKVYVDVTILTCKQFLKRKIESSQISEILSKHLSPIRSGRQYKRYQNLISAVAFQYRLS